MAKDGSKLVQTDDTYGQIITVFPTKKEKNIAISSIQIIRGYHIPHISFFESILSNFGWNWELSFAITALGMFFWIIPVKSRLRTATSAEGETGIAQLVKLIWRFPMSWGYP